MPDEVVSLRKRAFVEAMKKAALEESQLSLSSCIEKGKNPLLERCVLKEGRFYDDPQLVFVLSGGGVKGAFYVGFLKELRRQGITPDLVVGTSAGGLAAIAHGLGMSAEEMEELMGPEVVAKMKSPLRVLWALIKGKLRGVIDPTPVAKIFEREAAKRGIYTVGQLHNSVATAVLRSKTDVVLFGNSNGTKLSPEVPVGVAAASTMAVPGAVLPPVLRNRVVHILDRFLKAKFFGFERSIKQFHVHKDMCLDGGVLQNLPLETATTIVNETTERGAVFVAVNLGYTGHLCRYPGKRFFHTVKEIWKREKLGMAMLKTLKEIVKRPKELIEDICTNNMVRLGVDALEIAAYSSLIPSLMTTPYPVLLVNANYDESLSEIGIFQEDSWDMLVERGEKAARNMLARLGMGEKDDETLKRAEKALIKKQRKSVFARNNLFQEPDISAANTLTV
ncbi:MAG: patatin-like phospholipase family protein [Candidatus Anstonellales archaeon]